MACKCDNTCNCQGEIMNLQSDMTSREIERHQKWYIINAQTLAQIMCFVSLGILGINYLLYSFFQFDFNRNILRIVAGAFFILSILLGKRISVREFCLIPVAAYMLIVNGSLSSNIAYFILAAIAIPYVADIVWKQLNMFQIVMTIVVILCLVLGIVNNRVTSIAGRTRNTLGFTNVNAAAIFFFSLLIIWLLKIKNISVKHLLITIAISFAVYRLTDSRTVFACTMIFSVCYLVLSRWNGRWTSILFGVCVTVFYLSPVLVIMARSAFPTLDIVLSSRLKWFSLYIANHSINTLLFGGSKIEGIDNFYLCLLYNGGIFFYIFTWYMNISALSKYILRRNPGYAAFIIAITAYGLMESGVIRCELLCMIMFWYLLLRPLKNEEREEDNVRETVAQSAI